MSDSACFIELASNNGDYFTDSLLDDVMIRPQYPSQRILIGTSNATNAMLVVSSNTVSVNGVNIANLAGSSTNTSVIQTNQHPSEAGYGFSVMVNRDGTLLSWGNNGNGQLGDGTTTPRLSNAVIPSGLSNVIQVSCGNSHAVALQKNGQIAVWGNTIYIGTGGVAKTSPYIHPLFSNARHVSAGELNVGVVLEDGKVFMTGSGVSGQLGDNTTIAKTSFVEVLGVSNAVSLSLGSAHSLALLNNGTVMGWGKNTNGQLGQNNIMNLSNAAIIPGLSNIRFLVAGAEHSLFINTTGTLQACGLNSSRQLGDGTNVTKSNVTVVPGISNALTVSGGDTHTIVLLDNGQVRGIGGNAAGQLATGNFTSPQSSFVTFGGISNVVAVCAGNFNTLLTLSDGTARIVGNNDSGQIGNGQIGSSSNVNSLYTPSFVSNAAQYKLMLLGGYVASTTSSFALATNSNVASVYIDSNNNVSIGNINAPYIIQDEKLNVYGNVKISNNLYVLSNQSIGNSNPSERLEVANGKIYTNTQFLANSNDSALIPSFAFKEDSNTGMFHPSNDAIGLTTGGVERMRVDANGNVGIGTTTPSYFLDVNGQGRFSSGIVINNNTSLSCLLSNGTPQNFMSIDTLNDVRLLSASNSRSLYINPDKQNSTTSINFNNSNNTEIYYGSSLVLAQNNGKIGIGTATPSYPLDVVGEARVQSNLYIGMNSTTTPGPYTTGKIVFGNPYGDNGYEHAQIVCRMYGTTGEQSELVLAKFNDDADTGPDRIRLRAAAIAFDTFTTGGVSALSNNDNDLRTSNIRMYIQGNGNVGIGTTTPSEVFHVVGKTFTTNQVLGYSGDSSNTPAFSWTDDSNTGIYHPVADALALVTGGVERLRVLSDGKVGIGLSNPTNELQVNGTINATTFTGTTITTLSNVANWSSNNLFNKSGGTISGATTVTGVTSLSNLAYLYPNTSTNGATFVLDNTGVVNGRDYRIVNTLSGNNGGVGAFQIWDNTASIARIHITSNGDVGIGNTTPSAKLHVVGKTFTTNQVLGYSGDSSNAPAFSWTDDSNTGIYHPAADTLALVTGGVERMRVLSDGKVGVGVSNPSVDFEVKGTAKISSNLEVLGNLYIAGTTTTVNSSAVTLADNVLKLNDGSSYLSTLQAGIEINRGTGYSNYYLLFDEVSDNFKVGMSNGLQTLATRDDDPTNNSISYYNSTTKNYTSCNLFVYSNGYLGVGVSNPSYPLDVAGEARVQSNLYIGMNSTTTPGPYTTGKIVFGNPYGDTGYEHAQIACRMYGTTGEQSELILAKFNDDADTGPDRIRLRAAAIAFDTFTGGVSSLSNNDNDLRTSNIRMYIQGNGNVGIGTTTPSEVFHVVGKTFTTNQVLGYSGDSSNAPAFSWTDDSNTGIYHPAADTIGLVTAGAERLRVLSTGNVGIGTATPSYPLDVSGTMRSSDKVFSVVSGGNITTALSNYPDVRLGIATLAAQSNTTGSLGRLAWFGHNRSTPAASISCDTNGLWDDQGFIRISTNAGGTFTERVTITNIGNVGIGTTTPSAKLEAAGDIKITSTGLQIASDNSYIIIDDGVTDRFGFIKKFGMGAAVACTSNENVVFGALNSTTLKHVGVSNFSEHVRIAGASGNVGIGTTSPSAKLHVNGTTILDGGSKIVVQNGQDGGSGRGIYMWTGADNNWGIYMAPSGALKSLNGGTAAGGSGFTSHAIRFRVNNSSINGFIFENGSEQAVASIRGSDGMSYFAGNVGIGVTDPTYKLHVNGNMYATGDIIAFSDMRLKSNITPIESPLYKIHKLNGYTFNTNGDDKRHTGLVAQEVLEVLPEAVYKDNEDDGYYSVAYGNMAGLFVEAIKAIDMKYQEKIQDLQQQIHELKTLVGSV